MKTNNHIYLNTFLLLTPAIYTGFFPGKIVFITAICYYPILFYLIIRNLKSNKVEQDGQNIIWLFIVNNLIIFIRGLFDISTTQDQISTFGSMIFILLMFPLYIFSVTKKTIAPIMRSIVVLGIPLSCLTYLFPPSNGFMSFQHNISIVYIFVLFIPYLNKKWVSLVIILSIVGLTFDITRRSYLINLSFCIIILLLYYTLSSYLFKKITTFLSVTFIIGPIVFLALGVTGIFNVFTIGDSLAAYKIGSNINERNLFVDSRTGIYNDAFGQLKKEKSFLFGLGGNGKTKTSLTEVTHTDYAKIYREGRRSTESGMLNYIQWGGVVAALSYWMLMVGGAYRAIKISNNKLFWMLGCFLSFKVTYSFIEDSIMVNIHSFYIMLLIGTCYNKYLRRLSDREIMNALNSNTKRKKYTSMT